MKKHPTSIDGFTLNRPSKKLGSVNSRPLGSAKPNPLNSGLNRLDYSRQQPNRSVGRSDIDESLRDIDESGQVTKKLSRRQRRRIEKNSKKQRGRAKRILKWIVILFFSVVVVLGSYAAYRFVVAGNNIFQGNIFGFFQSEPLKQDSNGRSNFLILGTSEDDPGHGGADLTDSMMVVSIDQKNKNIYMFSVPRDLYVDYGMACISGYAGKINAYFSCVDDGTTAESEQKRLTSTQALVGEIYGLDIQYGIHVNHTVIKEAVDAVGGIDVNIQGSGGEPGILDRNFDWRCKYTCYLVKYDNGIHHLDGKHALYLSMARGDIAPTYGLGNSNFDREKNQQKIIIALKNKAMSTGTLTDIGAVTKLIDSFGSNLRTNIKSSEIRTLMQVASEVKSEDVNNLSLFGDENPLLTTGTYGGASSVVPSAGVYQYGDIQDFIKKSLSSDPVITEAAPIVVLNGTGKTGYGQTKADELSEAGYNVTLVDTAPDGSYEKVEVYQIGSGNSKTAARLSSKYGVKIKKTKPPTTVNGNVRFVIIFGSVTK